MKKYTYTAQQMVECYLREVVFGILRTKNRARFCLTVICDITMHALINKQHLYKYVYEIKLLMLESGCARKLNQEHKTTKAR